MNTLFLDGDINFIAMSKDRWCHSVVATEGGCGGAEDVVV